MKRYIAVILAVLIALLWATPALAFGPLAHARIAVDIEARYPPGAYANIKAWEAGNEAPDMALAIAYAGGVNDGTHSRLHNPAFLATLKSLPATEEQRWFVRGFETHMISDGVENVYSAQQIALGAPYGADQPGLGSEKYALPRPFRSVTVSTANRALLLVAWNVTYPGIPWTCNIDQAQQYFMLYLVWTIPTDPGNWYTASPTQFKLAEDRASLALFGPPPLVISTTQLDTWTLYSFHSQYLAASGGTIPYRWTAIGLPDGLVMSTNMGAISGVAMTRGDYTVAVTVTDSAGVTAQKTLLLCVR